MKTNSNILKQYIMEETIANEPWPSEVFLYQPHEAENILLAENASCLAVKTYLNMCNLPYKVVQQHNAEFLSPGGRMTKLPVLRAGAFLVSEFEPIVTFLENKQIALHTNLDQEQKQDMRSHISLVEYILTNAELYFSYLDEANLHQITRKRYGDKYPWPLNHYQNWVKRQQVLRQLKVYNWDDMTVDEVIEKVTKYCEILSSKLENQLYFFGEPTELDAIVFGHLYTIITTNLSNNILAETVSKYNPLIKFCANINEKYPRKNIFQNK